MHKRVFAPALFGGIPATGAIARTAANIKSGGRTPVAGMIHAAVLVLVLVVLMPYAALIPILHRRHPVQRGV